MFFKICLFVCFFSVISNAFSQKQEPRLVLPIGHTYEIYEAEFSPDGNYCLTYSLDNTVKIWEKKSGLLLRNLQHLDCVTSAKFSIDGTQILTSSADKTACLWDLSTGNILHKFQHSGSVFSAEFSSNQKLIVTAGNDTIRIWENSTGKLLSQLIAHEGPINSVVFNKEGTLILSTSWDNTARVWETKTGKLLRTIKCPEGVFKGIFSPDGKTLLTISRYDSIVYLWDCNSGAIIRKLGGHNDYITSAKFNFDGNKIISTSYDKTACIWDSHNGNILYQLKGHNKPVTFATFSSDEKIIITTSEDGNSKLWNCFDGKELVSLKGHKSFVNYAAFSKDLKFIITASLDNTAIIWETSTGKLLQILKGETGEIKSIKYSPDEKNILTSFERSAIIWETKSGKNIYSLKGHKDKVITSVFSPNGKSVLTASYDSTAKIWDQRNGVFAISHNLYGHEGILTSANFNPEGNMIATSSSENTAHIWNLVNKDDFINKVNYFNVINHEQWVTSALFSKDGKIITTSWDRTAQVWDKDLKKIIHTLRGHTSYIYSACFSPDQKMILTASADSTIRLWDINSGNILKILKDHSAAVNSAIFNSDGSKILSSSDDKTARIWNTKTGKTITILEGHFGNVKSAIFSSNDKYIFTIGDDHKTILWDVATGKALYTRLQLQGNDWLVYDEHYRFDGSPGAIEKLYFVCGLELVELNQVKDSLYVPNLVQRIMNGENLNHLPKLSELQICGVTPLVEPLDEKNYKYRITPRTGGIGDIDIYINGVVRQTINTKKLKKEDNAYVLNIDPSLIKKYSTPGEENQIKVIAKTANNSISSRGITIQVQSTENKKLKQPSVHAVMIGIDDYKGDELDLNYAAKDANDFQIALQLATKKYFNTDDTNRVNFYNLTIDRNAKIGTDKIKGITPDRGAIFNTLHQIEKNSKPEDLFILFFAGHGEIVDTDQLLLLTTEAGKSNFQGIRMRELLEQVNKIPAGKRILILDACHSGAAINNLDMAQYTGKRDVKDAALKSQRLKELDKLASKSGFVIITASSSDQKALELPQYEHGLLTYALLNAMLNNKNALNENNQLQLNKWLDATEEEMKKLSKDQSAESMVPISFIMGKIDDEVRNSIQLKELPTVFIENVMNLNIGFDNLGIKKLLADGFAENSRGAENKLFIADTPGAIHINIIYETTGLEITAKIVLMKNQNLIDKITLNGNNKQLSDFINQLMQKVKSAIQK